MLLKTRAISEKLKRYYIASGRDKLEGKARVDEDEDPNYIIPDISYCSAQVAIEGTKLPNAYVSTLPG